MKVEVERLVASKPSGWELSMHVVSAGGRVLVHSPTYVSPEIFEHLRSLGEVTVLFAPNYFHHLSLERFANVFPTARVVAGDAAIPASGSSGMRESSRAPARHSRAFDSSKPRGRVPARPSSRATRSRDERW
jgi:hypothetical protein